MNEEQVNQKIFDLLDQTGLNWTVMKNQLFDAEQRKTESYGIFRKDSGMWLGTVGNRYEPFQNWEMAQIMVEATHNIGLELSRGGLLSGGQKVYLQAQLPEQKIGKSAVMRWISTLNTHDGTSSFGFGSTNTVVVCRNTFYKAYGELQKFRHTTSLKERVAIAQKNLMQSLEFDQIQVDKFKQMADLKMSDKDVQLTVEKLFDVNLEKIKADLSTRKMNQIKSYIDSVKQSVSEQGDSLWALYNGITRYTNHVVAPAETSAKDEFLMTGGGRRMNDIGFESLMKIVDERLDVKPKIHVV